MGEGTRGGDKGKKKKEINFGRYKKRESLCNVYRCIGEAKEERENE